uniref:Putative secreted protein ovary overexpressed n=1 Tax=Rhipicephalus microplus TaxID=6941 RepID=A0A6M2DBC8_RHIMP
MCAFMLKLTGVRRLLCVASTFHSVFCFPSVSGKQVCEVTSLYSSVAISCDAQEQTLSRARHQNTILSW